MPERADQPQFDADDVDVKRLRLEPGDIVVVNVDRELTVSEAGHIKTMIEQVVAPHPVLVTSRGVSLEIIEPA